MPDGSGVLAVGGGILGLAIAREAARSGLETRLLESRRGGAPSDLDFQSPGLLRLLEMSEEIDLQTLCDDVPQIIQASELSRPDARHGVSGEERAHDGGVGVDDDGIRQLIGVHLAP